MSDNRRPASWEVHFTVASELLRELGERLVGRPSIALAELIKNSYDADATLVKVTLEKGKIVVADNGHGMTREEFESYWMRIGSAHKRTQEHSRLMRRPLTGSKGVGRLAAQFLAHEVSVITKASDEDGLFASVDWDKAVTARELTEATARLRSASADEMLFPLDCEHGTRIELNRLKQEWTEKEVKSVAHDIWMLQPPLEVDRAKMQFLVDFQSDRPGLEEDFEKQMRAILDIWHARITGKLIHKLDESGQPVDFLQMMVEFRDGEKYSETLEKPNTSIEVAEYEVRVYDFIGRQRYRIPVLAARTYVEQFCNVSVYDGGFRLPFYGRETDWLDIELTHSHRLTLSKLLPGRLQEPSGMRNLPTMTRILGSVRINTTIEQQAASSRGQIGNDEDYLQISITRDRLVDNSAFRHLKKIVRTGLDYYAILQTRRKVLESLRIKPTEPFIKRVERVEQVLDQYRDALPPDVFQKVHSDIVAVSKTFEVEKDRERAYIGLLGSLATAGMIAVSYQHEIERRISSIEGALVEIEATLSELHVDLSNPIVSIRKAILEMRKSRSLFKNLTDEGARERTKRFRAGPLIRDVHAGLERFLRGARLDITDLPEDLRLPPASYMDWTAVFQNILTNAANAMLDSVDKIIRVSESSIGNDITVRLEDTGSGVDLRHAENLFEPFVRRTKISSERRALGLGGTGLGLTIVRMISERIGCKAEFLVPSPGFKTCFALTWREKG